MNHLTQAQIEAGYPHDFRSALECLLLVGQQVRAAHGSEHWSFALNPEEIGTVVDVHIPSLTYQTLVVRFANGDAHLSLHDIQKVLQ